MTPTAFALAVIHALGAPAISVRTLVALLAWMRKEGGAGPQWGGPNLAAYNPLNTSWPMPGSHAVNADGVQSYRNWSDGIAATVATLRIATSFGRPTGYPAIVDALRFGTTCAVLSALVGASLWGTGPFADLCPPAPAPPDPPHPPIEEDDMQAFIAVSASREAIVWPDGPATELHSPNDGSLMAAPPLALAVVGTKTDPISEPQMDAFLARPS